MKNIFKWLFQMEKWLLISRNFIPDSYSWRTIMWIKLFHFSSNSTNKNIFSLCKTLSVKAMAPHSSTLAWKIPWTEKPGRLHAVHGVAKSDLTEQLHFHFSLSCTGEGNGNPLQCSCLENPGDGGAWWPAVYGIAHSRTRLKRLSSRSSSSSYSKSWWHFRVYE